MASPSPLPYVLQRFADQCAALETAIGFITARGERVTWQTIHGVVERITKRCAAA